jgi:hypothetical protein
MHEVEGVVDGLDIHRVGNERGQFDIAPHRVLYHSRQLGAALYPAKCRPLPGSPSHKLEWSGRDFLTGACNTNDHRLSPTPMGAFQRSPHDADITDALKGVINTPSGHIDDDFLDRLGMILGVDAFGRAKNLCELELRRIGIDRNDTSCLGLSRALNDSQANASQTEHRDSVPFLHLGSVMDGTDSGSDATP